MSYVVARMTKYKSGNLGGAYRHNERIFKQHSNKDIDIERSHLNYELTDRDRSMSYEKQIKNYIDENKISKRAIRKDAVLCDEWIITSDKDFFAKLTPEETKRFFETSKNYFAENYGLENIAYASVHLDENTPHMHMGIVPMKQGKLSSKSIFNREELKKIQDELPKYLSQHGFHLQRGELDSTKKHLSTQEYKDKQEVLQKIEKQIDEKFDKMIEFNSELKQMNKALTNKVNDLKMVDEEKNKMLSNLDHALNEKQDTLSNLEKEINIKKEDLDIVDSIIGSKSETIDSMNQDIKTKQGTINELTKQLREHLQKYQNFDGLNISQLENGTIGKQTLDGKIKLSPETLNNLIKSVIQHFYENRQLSQTIQQQNKELNMLRNVSSNKNQILDELRETKNQKRILEIENNSLKNKISQLRDRLNIASRKLGVWRNQAQNYMKQKEFQNLTKQLNAFKPIKLVNTVKVIKKIYEQTLER
ncbi:MobV family relaxase [Streptococcus sp. 517s]